MGMRKEDHKFKASLGYIASTKKRKREEKKEKRKENIFRHN
jgi:hypothetical protein